MGLFYLPLFLLVVAAVGGGISLVVGGALSSGGESRNAVLGSVLLGTVALWIIYSAWTDVDEWNPHPIDQTAVVGTWRDGDAVLQLRADGSYRLSGDERVRRRLPVGTPAGQWRVDDWNLYLDADDGGAPAHLRLVVARGEYRIIRHPSDPDDWDGDLGFARLPRSRAQQ